MRLPRRRRRDARRQPFADALSFLAISSCIIPIASAVTFTPAPPANIDFSQLGQVAIAGDFSGISLFQFEEQNEKPFNTNGSESLLARLPTGDFASIINTDASIQAMCNFMLSNGSMQGVVVGGNFTSLGQLESTAIALFNPNTSQITPLSGLSGQVSAIYCDQDTDTVYVGGNFKGADSTNAIAWYGTTGWQNLPFAGFNGPVSTITKASNGHIIFGGSFTGLGKASAPTQRDGQIINLSTANISSGSSTAQAGFSDPRNIVCKTGGADGAGNTWLLEDKTPGFWEARFSFGFQPTKLRLWNTRLDGRGTKTWRFTALPLNGIMNFTYIDPATGQNSSCTSECPLSNDNSTFQDFHFVNVIGMDAFRIDISDFYGNGGGFTGIELFEDDVFSYAINDFNEPACAALTAASASTSTGPWQRTPSYSSSSDYLTANLQAPITEKSASVVFQPDIKESGFYSVNLYTPGCMQDGTCSTRGQIHVTGSMAANPAQASPLDVFLYQTNNFDKYDQIYFGYMDASSSSFRPSVTMTPKADQGLTSMSFVAQRAGFTVINSTAGLNGLFEYDPSVTVVNSSDFGSSAFDILGSGFDSGSAVNALATAGDVTFIGGNFTSSKVKNIIAVNTSGGGNGSVQALDGGLNGQVLAMIANDTKLYVGGQFSSTLDNTVKGMNNVAVYDSKQNAWSALGSGVNGQVLDVVAMTMNVSGTTPEIVIAFTGQFTQIEAFGDNPAATVTGFAIWVPSQGNWLNNLNTPIGAINGILTTSLLNIPGVDTLYAGSLSSSSLSAGGAATLGSTIGGFPARIQASQSSPSSGNLTKRDGSLPSQSLSGVTTGLFYDNGGRNVTVLAGHFSATATNGSTINNLLFINGTNNDNVSGLGPSVADNSTFLALAVQQDTLFAGGNVYGNVNGAQLDGLVTYNLASSSFGVQPPALTGPSVSVSSIAVQPNGGDVYVGGAFTSAGSLPCPAVCLFSTSAGQWKRPGLNLQGNASSLFWATSTQLIAGGSLSVNGSSQTFLASYDSGAQTWSGFPGGDALPGPVALATSGSSDGKQIWVAGTASNGTTYLEKYDGSKWIAAGQALGMGTIIRSLQVFTLTQSHDSTTLLDASQALMLTGQIVVPNFGLASAAIFNGTTFQPYALTTNSGNTAGSIAGIFAQNQNFFGGGSGHLALGFVVLIGLAIALALMLLIVVAGLLLDRLRKKREGYVPAPTSMYDRGSGMQRIPPHELLQSLQQGKGGAPHV
jgi:hypothetical protein